MWHAALAWCVWPEWAAGPRQSGRDANLKALITPMTTHQMPTMQVCRLINTHSTHSNRGGCVGSQVCKQARRKHALTGPTSRATRLSTHPSTFMETARLSNSLSHARVAAHAPQQSCSQGQCKPRHHHFYHEHGHTSPARAPPTPPPHHQQQGVSSPPLSLPAKPHCSSASG